MTKQERIDNTINDLFQDSKMDHLKILKGAAKALLRPMQPSDFKDVYLSISKEQGEHLVQLIIDNNIKSMVEFGTSFGISTLYLAQGAIRTDGNIITTELLENKVAKACENFVAAGVSELIDVRIGDAMDTLKDHDQPIDLLFLDGWKNLYIPLFNLLEPNFHQDTIVYVDNADMSECKQFLSTVKQNPSYKIESLHHGKAALILKST